MQDVSARVGDVLIQPLPVLNQITRVRSQSTRPAEPEGVFGTTSRNAVAAIPTCLDNSE